MPHKRCRSAAATNAAAAAPGVHAAPIDVTQLPPAFARFLAASGIDAAVYDHAHTLPRYVRCNALRPPLLGAPALSAALGTAVAPVGWLPAGWYSLDCGAKIVGAEPYRNGRLYGLDACSGAAALALGCGGDDAVLDLCAAPGGKLCLLAEQLAPGGSVTGVDVDTQRLNTARNMARRYGVLGRGGADPEASRLARRQVWRGPLVRLVHADGTAFDLPPPAEDGDAKGEQEGQEEERGASSESGRASPPRALYERVLVDAECTHDGSLKHIAKFGAQWGWDTLESKMAIDVPAKVELQKRLLRNGFRLLKPDSPSAAAEGEGKGAGEVAGEVEVEGQGVLRGDGAALVYSTCSLTVAQNEGVVEWLLAQEPSAKVVPIAQPPGVEEGDAWPCVGGGVEHSLRFEPSTSRTSGLFICKIIRTS